MSDIRAGRGIVPVVCAAAGVMVGVLSCAGPVRGEATRAADDQLRVMYGGTQVEAGAVVDASGVGDPLHLAIGTPKAVQWRDGVLCINASASVASQQPAAKLNAAVRESGALTVEVWIRPANDRQSGPARIISVSAGASERNFSLSQEGDKYDFRLRTTERSGNGIPSTATAARTVRAGELTHLCATRSPDGAVVIYINGEAAARASVGGDCSNWNRDYRLTLANETTGDRPWLGELHMAAVYSRALSEREVAENFAAGVPGGVDYEELLPPASPREIDFVADVQPILRARCFECHASGNEEGGLNLSVRSRVFEGGVNGRPFAPGDSAHSRLIHLVAGVREGELMPPEGDRLSDEQIGILRGWIDQGAHWPPGADVLDPRTERAREHWAFQPLREVEPPPVSDPAWGRTPIDRFILAALDDRGLEPSAAIDPRRLIRRICFDVVGLPPTADEIDPFIAEYEADADAAVARLVERLLESEHYGERWGRHWLDVARYADSCGQEGDQDRPHAYHYRNFVIRAFNDDLPWDTFVKWQLAGDEYEPGNAEAVAATGFLVGGTSTVLDKNKEYLEEELLRNRYNELDDIVATTGSAFLALTVGCARCHDHKYDAISAREYYRLLAGFHGGDRADVKLPDGREAFVFAESGSTPVSTWLFERADFYDRDQPVNLGFIDVLLRGTAADEYWTGAREAMPDAASTLQRRAMAEWMTDVEHGAGPLLARVIVNRVWQHHFGEGIVRTTSDFGVRADPPTHPELLDWLASELIDNGWRLKPLHRLILTSSAYRQSSAIDAGSAAIDPENRLLWRMRPQRLEAEILRDVMLSAAGTLNLETYGRPFKPPIPKEANTARNLKSPYPDDAEDSPATRRRSVYMFHKRLVPFPLLQAFDRPDLLLSCAERDNTTVAPQALALLNDAFVRQRAVEFADRLLQSQQEGDAELVRSAFAIALGRAPTVSEESACIEFLSSRVAARAARKEEHARLQATADFCQTVFSLNEFLYVD